MRERLQRIALFLRAIPGVPAFFAFWYFCGERAFVRIALHASRGSVRAVYLRRGGGRGELLPGASDLDFFLVLAAIPGEREMELLKTFWRSYHRWRRVFPFFGEVLMGEESELRQWLESPGVRSHEARYAWRRLAGSDVLAGLAPAPEPDARDVYSEALKSYCALLQPVLKLPENELARPRAWSRGGVHLRHAAKAALDLYRLHFATSLPPGAERDRAWRAPRAELARLLPPGRYPGAPELSLLLSLRIPASPSALFAEVVHHAAGILHHLAARLDETGDADEAWEVVPEVATAPVDRYSLSVRELYAERLLLRHPFLSRAVLSESTTQLYFMAPTLPPLDSFRELLGDLRDVSFSFDRFSVALPLTETAFRQLERTPFFDNPFHAYSRQREARLGPDGMPVTLPYRGAPARIPERMLAKTFAELSFSLRFPPPELEFLLEGMVGLVLGLRVASERREVAHGFAAALTRFTERFPERGAQLEKRLAPYLGSESLDDAGFWNETFSRLGAVEQRSPEAARSLRSQLEDLRAQNRRLVASSTQATDLWINLTPFLRMEMGALKERYFRHRGPMKV